MSKKKTQKVLIPKGTIDPNQDILIEIPESLRGHPLVVANKSLAGPLTFPANSSNLNNYYNVSRRSLPPPMTSRENSLLDDMLLPNIQAAENEEAQLIQTRLSNYQQARRQFLLDTTHVASKSIQTIPQKYSQWCDYDDEDFGGKSSRSHHSNKLFSSTKRSRRSNYDDDDDDDDDSDCACSTTRTSNYGCGN